jgi:NAD(P)-dependent dehydrogenase (short-subunit alcohol dehydrogenase family)
LIGFVETVVLKDFSTSYWKDTEMNYNPFSLESKIILVTGASSGIGRAVAIECAKLGAKVIITARNEERLIDTLHILEGDGHQMIVSDLTQEDNIKNLVDEIPVIDGIAQCAGKGLTLPLLFASRKKFDGIFDINFFAPVELLRLIVKNKKLKSSAVFIVSVGGTGRWTPGNAIYGSSKAALQSMINYFAIELGHKKIRVNGVNPGMVETPLIQHGLLSDEQLEADKATYPLERYGKPEDIAHSVAFLLSDASSWITGHSIVIDGGITAR